MPGRLNEIHSRIAQLISIATVIEVDCQNAKARVEFNKVKSSWLPWLSSHAGSVSSWAAIEVGEQVVLLCPSGNLNQAIILRGLYHQKALPPSTSPAQTIVNFKDGSSVSHDSSSSTITINSANNVVINGSSNINLTSKNIDISASNITLKTKNLKVSGNVNVDGVVIAKAFKTPAL